MPQWAGSCWYELRYCDPTNAERFVDPEIERYWMGPRTDVRPAPPTDTRTTEQQIADLDREIEEWRLRQEIEKRRRDGEAPTGSAEAGA